MTVYSICWLFRKDWTKTPTPVGVISPTCPLFLIQFNNKVRILPTLTANANLDITSKGDLQNVSMLRATAKLNLSVTNVYSRENIFYFNRTTFDRVNQLPILACFGITLTF